MIIDNSVSYSVEDKSIIYLEYRQIDILKSSFELIVFLIIVSFIFALIWKIKKKAG